MVFEKGDECYCQGKWSLFRVGGDKQNKIEKRVDL